MEYIYIGKIVNTHGIKGELRILSDFEFKEKVFIPNNDFYIGEGKLKEKIVSYRHHKQFEMVKFDNIDNINDVLKYKGKKVYFLKNDLNLKEEEILESELIGMKTLFNNDIIGYIIDIQNYNGNKVLYLDSDIIIPYNDHFVEKINKEKKEISFKNIEGLIK